MSWVMVGRALRLAFLLRIPLLTLALLAAFGPVSLGHPLLDNVLDQGHHVLNVALVSFAAFLLAFTAIATLNLTLYYGSDRLDEHGTVPLEQKRPMLTFVLGTGVAAVFVGTVVYRTEHWWPITLWWSLVGAAVAFALVIIAKVVQLALTDPVTTPHPPPFLIFPAYRVRWAERQFDRVYCWSSPRAWGVKGWFTRRSQWPLRVLQGAGQGYLVNPTPPAGTPLQLRSGHVFTMTLALMAFAAYLVIGWIKRDITKDPVSVPALVYLLLFFIVACWVLSGLTFFFDRYRFPLLAVVAALAMITAQAPKSDHFFRVDPARPLPGTDPRQEGMARLAGLATPGEHVSGRMENARYHRLIFIATPGGGIQAAAWTTKVLSKLEEIDGDPFRNAVGLISSVSGGSLGSMIYAATFAGHLPRNAIVANARQSALDEIAWGWTFADFWRAVAPWFGDRTVDRGFALEEKWAAVNNLGTDTFLGDWAGLRAGMPALIFNAMMVEPGRHVVFSTTRFPAAQGVRGIDNFYALDPKRAGQYDLRVTTAARLSASFPFVAPAARPDLDSMYAGDYHYVDGGYYDNYGIDALIGWLDEALRDRSVDGTITDVLILTIRHFKGSVSAKRSVRGWSYQLYAPLSGLLSMWTAAPAQRDANEFGLFAERISKNGVRRVWIASISYDGGKHCAKAPLSWKLSQSQQTCIDDAWQIVEARQSAELDCIRAYLDGKDAPTCQYPRKTLQ
jgi:predicted acylesterase/phospholipase RssA